MEHSNIHSIETQKDLLYKLQGKKNLMVYEGYRDNLENGIGIKYFYSNPHEPLEFVNLDLLNQGKALHLNGKRIIAYGSIHIIRDRKNWGVSEYLTDYGLIRIEELVIRDIEKAKITLFINHMGIEDLSGLIDYFESNYCSRSYSLGE